jgi:hypothetical protein
MNFEAGYNKSHAGEVKNDVRGGALHPSSKFSHE